MSIPKHILWKSIGILLISSVFAKNRMSLFADSDQKSADVIKMAEISTNIFLQFGSIYNSSKSHEICRQ